jgi:hypothetical protein
MRTLILSLKFSRGKDCDKIVFGTDIEESRLSFSIKVEHPGPEAYSTMGLKVWSFLKRIYEDYGDDFDWIFVSGDDTFLMVEHLRQYLATLKDEEALYLGQRWVHPERASLPAWTNDLIFNAGAGYVLNRKALKLWYETCSNAYTLYESIQSGEDIAMAECLRRANILPLDTRDKFGAERFHAFSPLETAKTWYRRYVMFECRGFKYFKYLFYIARKIKQTWILQVRFKGWKGENPVYLLP